MIAFLVPASVLVAIVVLILIALAWRELRQDVRRTVRRHGDPEAFTSGPRQTDLEVDLIDERTEA